MGSTFHVIELPAGCICDGTLVEYEQDRPEYFVLRRTIPWGNGGMDAALGAAFLTRVDQFKHSREPMKPFYLGGEPSNRTLIVDSETRLRLTFKDDQDLVAYLRNIRDPGVSRAVAEARKAVPRVKAHEWEKLDPPQEGMFWRCKVCGTRTNGKDDGPHWNGCMSEPPKRHIWVEVNAKEGTKWECKDCGFETDSPDERVARAYDTCPGAAKTADGIDLITTPWALIRLRTRIHLGVPDVLTTSLGWFTAKEVAIQHAASRTRSDGMLLNIAESHGLMFMDVNDRALIVGPDGITQLSIDQLRVA